MKFDTESRGSAPTEYLEAAARILQAAKTRSYELLHAHPGDRIIDVGCGPGLDTSNLARLVGPEGLVIGIDRDHQTAVGAYSRAAAHGVQDFVLHQRAEASKLPFRSECFNAVRCERMLMHLKTPESAVHEMIRVLKPGGWIVLVEPDWGTLSISSTLTTIERRLAEIRADHTLPNGYAGRTIYQLLRERDLQHIMIEVFSIWSTDLQEIRYLTFLDSVESQALEVGFTSEHEIGLWRQDLEALSAAGHCFAQMNLVMVAGQKNRP